MRRTVSDRVRARGSLVVGRDEELVSARRLLADPAGDDASTVALHVHGPGGVGKTAYLREVERLAAEQGRPTLWIDAEDAGDSRAGVLGVLGVEVSGALAERLPAGAVVLVDRFERFAGLEAWFWSDLVMALPDDARLVTGGRRPPTCLDDRLRDLVEVLPLRNLSPAAATSLLRVCGVPGHVDVDDVVARTYGHPLALVIAADAWAAAGGDAPQGTAATLLDHPDPGARLLGRFVDEVEDPRQRAALHVAAHARRVDRVLLRDALGVDEARADDLLGWLRERPFAEIHGDGLALHDVVRDVLDADLRWRDPDGYEAMHTAVRSIITRRLQRGEGPMRVRAAHDLLYLHRGNPATEALYDYRAMGSCAARPAGAADSAVVEEVVTRVEGPLRAQAVGRVVDDEVGTVHLLEDGAGQLLGIYATYRIDGPELRSTDPVAQGAWDLVARLRPPGPGECVLLQAVADADHPHDVAVITDLVAAQSLLDWSRPDLGWVLAASRHPQVWVPIWTYVGFEELGAVVLGDDEVSVWGRDFGRSPFEAWLTQLRRRELDTTGTVPAPVASPVAWTREEFDGHVRDLLRDLHRPERVAVSALMRSELVRPGPGAEPAEQLRDAVVEAVALVEEDPVTRRAARAVDRTYLRGAATQEAAAAVLGMPFSTYRRHLARGVQEVADRLWAWEVHGGRQVSSS